MAVSVELDEHSSQSLSVTPVLVSLPPDLEALEKRGVDFVMYLRRCDPRGSPEHALRRPVLEIGSRVGIIRSFSMIAEMAT